MVDATTLATASSATTAMANEIGNTIGASPPPNGGNLAAAADESEAETRLPLNTNAGSGQRVPENTSASTSNPNPKV
jgi:hypothetical protein